MSANLTVTDLFAGAGGSSTGMIGVPGVSIRIAANHWQLAVDVHNANHPTTDHAHVDLHMEEPSYFPRTDVLWASPECTKWSQAGGGKARPAIEEGLFEDPLSDDAATRSRLLMFDVLRFAEHHQYRAIVVENVVDIATQPKYRLAWKVWREELVKLGYLFKVISLNSMHAQALGAPAPQSRDRLYVVCWRKGEREPDVDRMMRPRAWCPRCDEVVESRQAFKPGRSVGRYRAQYVYVHGACGTQVEPGWLPAYTAIDFTLRGQRIGDRDKPLADKTRARIAAGIARYWRPFVAEVAGNTFERRPGVRTWPIEEVLRTLHTTPSKALLVPVEGRDGKEARSADDPLRTMTTRAETALAMPFIAELRGGGSDARSTERPLSTVTANGNHHALITPAGGSWNEDVRSSDEALRTLTTREAYALVMRNNTPRGDAGQMVTPAAEELRTLTTTGHQSLLTAGDMAVAEAQVDDCEFRMLEPYEVAAGMAFPSDYAWEGTRRERVRMAGNAVTPPAARDLMAAVSEALTGEQVAA
ncbi:MAG TPA: DNA cytosine methyltransferase [Pseudonocardia sp.]